MLKQRVDALETEARVCANLQIIFGLRAREAISCGPSLVAWSYEAKNNYILVSRGTKGGKSRRVNLLTDEQMTLASIIIDEAIQIAKNHDGNLIKSSSLEGAARSYQREMLRVGFRGHEASHCLRYEFSVKQFLQYQSMNSGDEGESLARLSLDLGHGSGRGRYCKQVYLRSLFAKEGN